MIDFSNAVSGEQVSDFRLNQEDINTMLCDAAKKMLLHNESGTLKKFTDGDEDLERAASDAAKLWNVKGLFIDDLTNIDENYRVGTLSAETLRSMPLRQRARLAHGVLEILERVEELGIFAGCVDLGSIIYDRDGVFEPYIKNVFRFQMGCLRQTWPEYNRDEYNLPFFTEELQYIANTRLAVKILIARSDNLGDVENKSPIMQKLASEKIYSTQCLMAFAKALTEAAEAKSPKDKPFGERKNAAVCTVAAPCTSELSVKRYYDQIALINSAVSTAISKGVSKPVYAAYAWTGSKPDLYMGGTQTNVRNFAPFDGDYIPNIQYHEEDSDMSRFMHSYMAADAMLRLFDEDSDILMFVLLPPYDDSDYSGKVSKCVEQLKGDLGARFDAVYLHEGRWENGYSINDPESIKKIFDKVERLVAQPAQPELVN